MAKTFMGSIGAVDGCHFVVYGNREDEVRKHMELLDHEGATEWDVKEVVNKEERFDDFLQRLYDYLASDYSGGSFYAPNGSVPVKQFKPSDTAKHQGFKAVMWKFLKNVFPELWD